MHGLTHAVTEGWKPLHIVGDSSFIINQVRHHRKPKAPHLVGLHQQATRLATTARMVSWRHHLRAFNKMADAAVNIAMDDAASLQSTAENARAELDLLQPY